MSKALLGYIPLPNASGTVDGLKDYSGSPVNRPIHHNYLGRLDAVLSPNHRFFFSGLHEIEDTTVQNNTGNGFNNTFLGQVNNAPGIHFTPATCWPRARTWCWTCATG